MQLQERLDEAAARLAEIESDAAVISTERDQLALRLGVLAEEVESAEERVADRVRLLYKHGAADPVMALFSSDRPDEVLARAAIVVSLVRDDRAQGEAAAAKRIEAIAVSDRLADRQRALDDAIAQQRAVSKSLQTDLAEAAALERRLEKERAERAAAERRRQAAADAARRAAQQATPRPRGGGSAGSVPTGGGYACPVARPHSFTDTWGAPRSGGRRHKGTDILAPRGANIYATTSGVVNVRGYGSSAGYWLILRGNDGTSYYYMHLQSFAVGNGARVSAGQLIGYNGDTGNARGTPHLHFEQHPGGSAVNPYPFLRRACG